MAKRKYKKTRNLNDLVNEVVAPVSHKRGLPSADLFLFWDDIVGTDVAAVTQPQKCSWPKQDYDGHGHIVSGGAVLHVACLQHAMLVVQHQVDQIVERINGYFGYHTVSRVRLVAGSFDVNGSGQKDKIEKLPAEDETLLDEQLHNVQDDALKAALKKLGEGIIIKRLREN